MEKKFERMTGRSGMKRMLLTVCLALCCGAPLFSQNLDGLDLFSITTCPGEDASTQMRLSWGSDTLAVSCTVALAEARDRRWRKARVLPAEGRYCAVYDTIWSKKADGENFHEDARFLKYDLPLDGLKPKTEYRYVITYEGRDGRRTHSPVYSFRTAGARSWNACIISDFHNYPPLPGRLTAAMAMLDTVGSYRPYDWVLNLGDVCAWGGSYSFWVDLYGQPAFRDCMWASLNGNHDHMTRRYQLSNDFFRHATANPQNGYPGEEGVSYWFEYGDALFIMLNNETMRDSAGFAAASAWVEKVLQDHPKARYKVVCEHYQWFFGTDGRTSQFGRWHELFEKYGVNLALSGNNHIYVRAHHKGVVYIQTPSSDNERGQELFGPLAENEALIDFRWNEGPKTVGALHLSVTPKRLVVTLLDRNGAVVDQVRVKP